LQPPGGGGSNIFGAGEPEQIKVKDYYKSDVFNQKNNVEEQENTTAAVKQPTGAAASPFATEVTPVPEVKASPKPANKANPIAPSAPEAAAPAQSTKPRGGGINPITGEVIGSSSQQVHTSTRVRQPPGGASSGLW